MEEINLTLNEFNKLKKRYVGNGKEGNVYKYNRNYLYKIYTIPLRYGDIPLFNSYNYEYKIDDDGTKIITGHNKFNKHSLITDPYPYYLDNYGVKRIYNESVIINAMKRQLNIKLSTLPLAPLYIDNRFRGCILKNHQGYTDLHNMSFLPYKTKLKILKELLEKVKELNDNYVYPVELSNYKTDNNSHSNILINPITLNTEIIDLDGKSTVYTDTFNKNLSKISYNKFTSLVIKLLYDIDIEISEGQDIYEDDSDFLNDNLMKKGIDYNVAISIINQDYYDYKNNNELLNYLTLKKK